MLEPLEFCRWLEGFLAVPPDDFLSPNLTAKVAAKLDEVFVHEAEQMSPGIAPGSEIVAARPRAVPLGHRFPDGSIAKC